MRHAESRRIGDSLRLHLLPLLPAAEVVLLLRDTVRIGLNPGHVLAGQTLHFGMQLVVFFRLDRLELPDLFLPLLFVVVEGAIARDGVLQQIPDFRSGRDSG